MIYDDDMSNESSIRSILVVSNMTRMMMVVLTVRVSERHQVI